MSPDEISILVGEEILEIYLGRLIKLYKENQTAQEK